MRFAIVIAPLTVLLSAGVARSEATPPGTTAGDAASSPLPGQTAGESAGPTQAQYEGARANGELLAPETPGAPGELDSHLDSRTRLGFDKALPPPTNVVYFQYGVALGAEVVTSAGPICSNDTVPCILGTGGGITIRAGWRSSGAIYLGGAYAFSKQDPNKLLRLAILQQARAEGRYYFATGRDIEPYAAVSLGVAGYGNEWAIATYGPAASLGGGLEVQLTRRTVIGLSVAYRLLMLKSFTDTSGADRTGGIAQMVGLDLVLEQRDPIFTDGR